MCVFPRRNEEATISFQPQYTRQSNTTVMRTICHEDTLSTSFCLFYAILISLYSRWMSSMIYTWRCERNVQPSFAHHKLQQYEWSTSISQAKQRRALLRMSLYSRVLCSYFKWWRKCRLQLVENYPIRESVQFGILFRKMFYFTLNFCFVFNCLNGFFSYFILIFLYSHYAGKNQLIKLYIKINRNKMIMIMVTLFGYCMKI